MAGFIGKDGFTRQGSLRTLAAYLPNPSGTIIATPSTPTVESKQYTSAEVLVAHGNRFNTGYTTPGAQRTVRVCYLSYDKNGDLTPTGITAGVNVTPGASDNALLVYLGTIPAYAIFVVIFVDDVIANIIPTPPYSRRTGLTSTVFGGVIFYEPSGSALTADDVTDIADENDSPREFTRKVLPNTTGNATHTITPSVIDVPINDLPNEMILTRTTQSLGLTFAGPKIAIQSLFTSGTSFEGCGCATAMEQLGKRSGTCGSLTRCFELTLPGDSCNSSKDAVLYAKAFSPEAIEVNYSSEEAAHVPITITQTSSSFFKGQHDITYQGL